MPRGTPDLSRTGTRQRRAIDPVGGDVELRRQLVEIGMATRGDLSNVNAVANQAGFVSIAESTVSFVESTNTVTITPVSGQFSYYSDGTLYTEGAALSAAPSSLVEGLTYFYLDAGSLETTTQLTGDIIATKALVAATYWDSSNVEVILFNDMRRTETSAHRPVPIGLRMRYYSELDVHITSINGTGNDEDNAELTIDSPSDVGIVYEGSRPHIVYEGTQVLNSAAAQIPTYYRTSAGWRRQNPESTQHVVTTGSGRAAWNEFNGTIWAASELDNGNMVLMHYLAIPHGDYPVICVMGINEYTGSVTEEDAAFEIDALHLNGLASLCPVWFMFASVLFQTDNSYTNTVKSRTISTTWGDYRDWRDYESIGASLINSTRAAEEAQTTADGAVTDAAAAQATADANTTAIAGKQDQAAILDNIVSTGLAKFAMWYGGAADSPSEVTATTSYGRSLLQLANVAALLAAGTPADLGAEPESNATKGHLFNHFNSGAASQMGFSSNTSGSGTAVAQGWEYVNTTNNWMGSIKVETGTTATGFASWHTGNNHLIFGQAHAFSVEGLIAVEVQSSASEEFTLWYGFADNVTSSTAPTRGAFFRYDRAATGDHNWRAVTRSGGVETVTDTGVAVTAGFTQTGVKLKVVVDLDGTEVRFYIADSLVATHTTNINTSGRHGYGGTILKSAGTTEVGAGWDWNDFWWSDADDLD
jgi:hypothetical protein